MSDDEGGGEVARTCPCGCEARIRRGVRGAAVGLERYRSLAPIAEMVTDAALSTNLHADDRVFVENLRKLGPMIERSLLEHLHGEASPAKTPNMLQIYKAQKAWEADLQEMLDAG